MLAGQKGATGEKIEQGSRADAGGDRCGRCRPHQTDRNRGGEPCGRDGGRAGLTHGGFYRHFRNKEQLVAEALSAAGDKTIAVVGRNIGKGGVNAAVDSYLSTSHRDSPSPICPFAALGSEMARAGEETKAAATEVLERLFATLAGGASGAEARGQAIVGLSTMIGAMTLARIVADSPLSEEILNRAKDHLHR